jgi:hypothetical protein
MAAMRPSAVESEISPLLYRARTSRYCSSSAAVRFSRSAVAPASASVLALVLGADANAYW